MPDAITEPESLDGATIQRLLDAFLVENEELENLTVRLSAFNLFQVLRVDKAEIRHSNVLAWLLTPDESHGLGSIFLRRFLSRLLLDNEIAETSLTPSQFELMAYADVEVRREWQNIDILVRSESQAWCLLIENKIHSKERRGQLQRYMERVREEMPNDEVIPVLLTLEGEEPSEDGQRLGFLPLSHIQVLELAEQIIDQHSSRIPDDARTFLNHYLETLRRLTMQDQELIELCKTIYRKHRQAIDLVIEYGTATDFQDSCSDEIRSLMKTEYAISARGGIWFLPKTFGECLPAIPMADWSFLPRDTPIACRCSRTKQKDGLRMILEVGPIGDPAIRSRLLRRLRDGGLKFRNDGLRDGAKYTRIASHSQKWKRMKRVKRIGQKRRSARQLEPFGKRSKCLVKRLPKH